MDDGAIIVQVVAFSDPTRQLRRYLSNLELASFDEVRLGDDLRLLRLCITGTGSASQTKTSVIPTASGLVFATAPDNKVHVYDSANGQQLLDLPLGGSTSGSPSMDEANGRQYRWARA